jgi:phosphatidylserine decarboxylase
MKYSGKARRAAFKLILYSLIGLAVVAAIAVVGTILAAITVPVLLVVFAVIWILFSVFTLYFFRDPNPRVPPGAHLVLSPAHGKVDVIDRTTEAQFMGGEVQRISVFLSVVDVHVQNAPISGKVALLKYTMGQFLNAMKAESAIYNENVLIGLEAQEPAGRKMAMRLIAGVIARRIVPFIKQGEEVVRGDRISLIQFGSRADIYLPLDAAIKVKVGDRVVGGETVLASLEG